MGQACVAPQTLEKGVALRDPASYIRYEGEGPWFTCDPSASLPIRTAKVGAASLEECKALTLIQLLQSAAELKGDKPALKVERPVPALEDNKAPPALPDEQWTTWTWNQYLADVKCAAKAAIKLGFMPHDSLNIWGFNSPEWMIAALAGSFAGGRCAGLYPTDTEDTAAFKVVHSGGSIVVVEDKGKIGKLAKGLAARGDAKRVKAIIAYGYEPKEGEKQEIVGCGSVPIYSWAKFMDLGRSQGNDGELEKRMSNVQPGQCAALIYTSGTTGDPKAVMVSHDNLHFESLTVSNVLKKSIGIGREAVNDRALSYLPLSHVAGMMLDIVQPIVSSASFPSWVTIYFARPYDLKVGAIKDRLQACRPTVFLGVPLVWEKIADKIRAIGASSTGLKKKLGDWAKGVNLEYSRGNQLGAQPGSAAGHGVAKAIMNKVKEGLGLDHCKYGLTGAAPIRVDTLEYFGSLDLGINEVYGMSECTGATTISMPEAHQWGSCGYEMPGAEVKVFLVDDADFNKKKECPRAPTLDSTDEVYQGELCYRGRHVMMGYMAQRDLGDAHVAEINKKTSETIDREGWLHSGDKGMITQAGMCKITGRYKELIIGEGGENIAPIPIEDHVKKMCDGIAEIMMVGDKRKYNIALVTLKAVGANGEVPGTDQLDAGAARVNPDVKTISAAMNDKVWIDALTAAITSANNNGKVCLNNAAKIQKFTILPMNFSEQNNELTPTKKLKRKVVETAYKDTIDKMYAANGTYIPYK